LTPPAACGPHRRRVRWQLWIALAVLGRARSSRDKRSPTL